MKKEDLEDLEKMLKNRDPKEDALEKVPEWKEQYYYELMDYGYVHTLDEFKNINRGGIIKVINIQDEELKKGGLVLDIKKNNKNKWYALVGIPIRRYIWKIYFHENYVFYRERYSIFKKDPHSESMRDSLSKFISNEDKIKYDKKNYTVERLFTKYVINKK
jgi:hypothetical protein